MPLVVDCFYSLRIKFSTKNWNKPACLTQNLIFFFMSLVLKMSSWGKVKTILVFKINKMSILISLPAFQWQNTLRSLSGLLYKYLEHIIGKEIWSKLKIQFYLKRHGRNLPFYWEQFLTLMAMELVDYMQLGN